TVGLIAYATVKRAHPCRGIFCVGLVRKMKKAKGGKSLRIQPALETQPRVIKKELTSGSRRQNKVESLNGKARTCPTTSSQSEARHQGPRSDRVLLGTIRRIRRGSRGSGREGWGLRGGSVQGTTRRSS